MHTQPTENTNITVYVQDDTAIEDIRASFLNSILEDLNNETASFN
ncbi:hypothetical protein ACS5PU_06610 [Pedobacter sp. GSP4]